MEVEKEVDEKYICPICCDVLKLPVMTPCSHLFCTECLNESMTRNGNRCPVCRANFEWKKCKKHKKLEKEIEAVKITCQHCKAQVPLVLYNNHTSSCPKAPSMSLTQFKPVATTSQATPSSGPNRATFLCPFCHLPNLDVAGLREHCNSKHTRTTVKKEVVCPICAAMPWGNPNQVSSDFISHLNLRHKFEYDTFVDYQQDEDLALEAALEASLQNH